MRRPLINVKQDIKLDTKITTASRTKVESGVMLDKRLRQKRSKAYIEAVTQLDAGGITTTQSKKEELLNAIKNEFPDLEPYQYPLGIIAKCYLGHPFEVHTLDISLDIIRHYKQGESLPNQMDRGRSLALHPSYEFIEIFSDTLRAVGKSGNVSVIKG
ncbi:hypothetical protein ACFSCZ_00155 [Siminovitchia sediminis]|uniref:Uncharacterized protein n=1 Tax=Siminovitchia sediminis TaxID=1274353 RepID=A0ABW4KEI2_9BACI